MLLHFIDVFTHFSSLICSESHSISFLSSAYCSCSPERERAQCLTTAEMLGRSHPTVSTSYMTTCVFSRHFLICFAGLLLREITETCSARLQLFSSNGFINKRLLPPLIYKGKILFKTTLETQQTLPLQIHP